VHRKKHHRHSPACPAACGPVLSHAVTASDLHRPYPCSAFNNYGALASGGRRRRRAAQHAARGSGSRPDDAIVIRQGAWPAEGRLALGTLSAATVTRIWHGFVCESDLDMEASGRRCLGREEGPVCAWQHPREWTFGVELRQPPSSREVIAHWKALFKMRAVVLRLRH